MSVFGQIIETDATQRAAPGEPFAFRHTLGGHELFSRARLRQLAGKMPPGDYFVSSPAEGPQSPFYERAPESVSPLDVIDNIDRGRHKLLLKRLENHDADFRALLDRCLTETLDLMSVRRADVIRANSFVFLTGRNGVTPLHFDPEYSFFMQIAGPKTYNLWSPRDVAADDLERHYARLVIDVGTVAVKDAGAPRLVVALGPGIGLHQPPEAPHWVQTHDDVSVSYSIAFETEATRARARTLAFNRFARKLGASPGRYGANPSADRLKSASMRVVGPAIGVARRLARGR